MKSKAGVAALFLILIGGAALAQEFGRAGGGEIAALVKQPSAWSGSLGMTFSNASSRGFEGTAGGALLADRIWFFATARRDQTVRPIATTVAPAADGKIIALLGNRNTFAATATPASAPSSSLSLHFTSVVSSNAVFSGSVVTRRSTGEPALTAFTHW